jgi:hypothetical protein
MRSHHIIAGVVFTACCLASFASGKDMDARFSEFRVGDRCSVVVTAMGEPAARSDSSTLGVPHSRISWTAGSRTYVAVCVAEWLVSKRICQALPTC